MNAFSAAFAGAQHFFETPDENPEADAYEAFMDRWEPTLADMALAFDNASDLPGFADALSADMSVAQGRIVDSEDVLDAAFTLAYQLGRTMEEGCANQRRLSSLLGRACEAHGTRTRHFIHQQLRQLAERDWESSKASDHDGWEDF